MRTPAIVINGRYLTQPVTGVQRVARELVNALDTEIAEGRIKPGGAHVWIAVPRGAPLPRLRAIAAAPVGRMSGHPWEQIEFPWNCRRALKVNFCGAAPLAAAGQIVMFHDAAVFSAPASFTLPFRIWYRTLFRVQGVRAATVITVSEFSRSQLSAYCSIPEGKLQVVPPAADHIRRLTPDTSILRRLGLTRGGYALSVGSLHPNKNFMAVRMASALLDRPGFDFVVVGSDDQPSFKRHRVPCGALKFTGRLNDSELSALYRGAFCFISPSRYEGFGIPPLEAMHCGCPVIAARAAATPETCGDAVMYFDPDRPDELAERLSALFENPRLQDSLRQLGFEQAARFNWHTSARQLWNILATVAELPGASRPIE